MLKFSGPIILLKMNQLPNDISGSIFSFFTTKYILCTLKIINKYFNRVISFSPIVWSKSRIVVNIDDRKDNIVNVLSSVGKFIKHLELPNNECLDIMLAESIKINTQVQEITFFSKRRNYMAVDLTCLKMLKNLTQLNFDNITMDEFEGIEELSQLKSVTLSGCKRNFSNTVLFNKPGLINLETLTLHGSGLLGHIAFSNLPCSLHLVLHGSVANFGHVLQSVSCLSLMDDYYEFLPTLPKLLYFHCGGERLTLDLVTRRYAMNNKQLKSIVITCKAICCSHARDVLLLLETLPELEDFNLQISHSRYEFAAANHAVLSIYTHYTKHKNLTKFKQCLLLLKQEQEKEVQEMMEYLSYSPTFVSPTVEII